MAEGGNGSGYYQHTDAEKENDPLRPGRFDFENSCSVIISPTTKPNKKKST